MIAGNADGAVMIIGSIFMVVRNSHERGKKEEQYEQDCKAFVVAYVSSFKHDHRLTFAGKIVNKSFVSHNVYFTHGRYKIRVQNLRIAADWNYNSFRMDLLREAHPRKCNGPK